jgi:hypothetical protein
MNRKRIRHLRRSRGLRARRGVTLIELIVASTILLLGLLSIVGISASVARSLGQARMENLAALAAQSRFEHFAGLTCDSLVLNSPTTVTTRNVTEKWVVVSGTNVTRQLYDTVTWVTGRTTRKVAFESLIPCRS